MNYLWTLDHISIHRLSWNSRGKFPYSNISAYRFRTSYPWPAWLGLWLKSSRLFFLMSHENRAQCHWKSWNMLPIAIMVIFFFNMVSSTLSTVTFTMHFLTGFTTQTNMSSCIQTSELAAVRTFHFNTTLIRVFSIISDISFLENFTALILFRCSGKSRKFTYKWGITANSSNMGSNPAVYSV